MKKRRKKNHCSPSVGDLLPGQVVLKCVRINFIYWPQNPNRRHSAPSSGLTVSVGRSVVRLVGRLPGWLVGMSCSLPLGLAYWIFIYSLPLCLWHLTESWIAARALAIFIMANSPSVLFFFAFYFELQTLDVLTSALQLGRVLSITRLRPAIVLGLRRRSVNSQPGWQWTRARKCCKPTEITGKTVSMAGINQSTEWGSKRWLTFV